MKVTWLASRPTSTRFGIRSWSTMNSCPSRSSPRSLSGTSATKTCSTGGTSIRGTGSVKARRFRDTLYPSAPKPQKGKGPPVPELSYNYVYKFTPVMERR